MRHRNRTYPGIKARGGSVAVRVILAPGFLVLNGMKRARHEIVAHLLFALALFAFGGSHGALTADAATSAVIARVGDVSISREEFEQALSNAARRKFYHGKTPDGEMAQLQREVANSMVDNVLLVREATRQGLKPDADSIKRTLAEYETRYRTSEQWQTRRATLLPKLQKQLETDSLLNRLRDKVQDVPQPDASQLQTYYAANLDKFTEPERSRVSTILLKVDPSAPRPVWDKARADAANLVKKLRGGGDFAQQARQRSGDASAANGGDMGYLHRGMLAEPAQLVVDKLKIKEISEPVTLLQGVAIFRLDERKAALQNALAKVEPRARELWRREQGERAWQSLLVGLRKATPAVIDESSFLPVLSSADPAKLHAKAK